MIAALFVETGGVYYGINDVDPWDKNRDARLYNGPHPVVAHPPCERWGRYWGGGPSVKVPKKMGDDGGCFKAAFHAVNRFGGVIEHPHGSHAWRWFDIPSPPRSGGWIRLIATNAWTCCVEQGHYGHRARKATWLYYVGPDPSSLIWGPSQCVRIDEGFHSKEERHAARAAGIKPVERLSKRQRLATPIAFRDLLISLAKEAQ